MGRPTQQQIRTQDYNPAQSAQVFQSAIQAPIVDVDYKAQGLLQALKIGAGVVEDVTQAVEKERYNTAYQAASTGGKVDEKLLKKSLAYQEGAAAAFAKRNSVEIEAELNDAYDKQVDKNATPEELNKWIDDFIGQKYEGVMQDRVQAKAALPYVQAMHNDLMQRHMANIRESVKQDTQTSYAVIAADEINKTGKLDVSKLQSDMLPVLGGKDTNAVLSSIIANEAVTRGQPELLDAVPDRWADGTPSFKKSPQFDDYLRNAREAAENQRTRDQQKQQQEEAKAAKVAKQQAENDITAHILENRDMRVQTLGMLKAGTIDAETARTLMNFQESFGNQVEGHAANFGAIAKLEANIYAGQASSTDVMTAYSNGQFGYGESAQKEVSRLLSIAHSSKATNDDLFSKPAYRTYFDELSSIYAAKKDILGNPDAVSAGLEREAIRMYREKVMAGESPLDARNEVVTKLKPTTAQPANEVGMKPNDAFTALKSGRITPAQFKSVVTVKQLRDMNLDAEDLDLAVSALEAAHGVN